MIIVEVQSSYTVACLFTADALSCVCLSMFLCAMCCSLLANVTVMSSYNSVCKSQPRPEGVGKLICSNQFLQQVET
jgi:hypothetical protein